MKDTPQHFTSTFSDVTSASFVLNWSCGHGAILKTCSAEICCCGNTEQAGPWHFYIATVQTDEATFVRRCVTQGFTAHNMAEFERGKRSFPREGYCQLCVSSQVLIISQYLNRENDAAAYDHSWPGVDGWLHIGTLSANSILYPPWNKCWFYHYESAGEMPYDSYQVVTTVHKTFNNSLVNISALCELHTTYMSNRLGQIAWHCKEDL